MATRTVRLDPETERTLHELTAATGLSVSGVLKRGIRLLHAQRRPTGRSAFAVYQTLDLGKGGTALAPSTDTRRGIREALRRKHGR